MDELSENTNTQDEEKSPFSPGLEELCAALDRLYVKGNLSGRLNFRVRWPYAAPYVFGDMLLEQDAEGTPDKKARAKLEDESDVRRVELLAALQAIKEESVEDGVVRMTYVAEMLERYGRDFLTYIYSEDIVEALNPTNPEKHRKEWAPHLAGAKLVTLPREGVTYQELLASLPGFVSGTLSTTFNERAYWRGAGETV